MFTWLENRLRGGKIIALDGLYMQHENQIPVVVSPSTELDGEGLHYLVEDSYPFVAEDVKRVQVVDESQALDAWSLMREDERTDVRL